MKTIIQTILLFLLTTNLLAQNKLIFHTESVDSLLSWMQKGCNKNCINNLDNQPAAQLMEQILRNNEKNVPDYKKALEEFNSKDSTSGNIYLLNDTYKRQAEISELLNKIKKTDFLENVYKRAIRYFPNNYRPAHNYDVFFTAVGWQWGDAMSFDYTAKNGEYTVSDAGTPAIIFNLTLVCTTYGNTLNERMEAMEDVMSHELFHAIFFDYIKDNWLSWDNANICNNTLYLMLNEGIAHYIADGNLLRENYNKDDKLKQKQKQAFVSLSDSVKIIFNNDNKEEKRKEALNVGLYGKYWKKYVCITGLFMIYHIEQYYGAGEIRECIKNGPLYFLKKYEGLLQTNAELATLPDEIIKFVKNNDTK